MLFFKYLFFTLLLFFTFGAVNLADSSAIQEKPFKVAIIYSKTLDDFLINKRTKDKIPYIHKLAEHAQIRSYYMNIEDFKNETVMKDRAKKIDEKIQLFKPDIIIVYESPALEYYIIPYVYEKGKNNSFFFCMKDHELDLLNKKYQLEAKYKTIMNGIKNTDNIDFLKPMMDGPNAKIKNIFLISNKTDVEDNDYVIKEIKNQFPQNNIEIFPADSSKDLKILLNQLQKKDPSIIINLADSIIEYSTGRKLSHKQIAEIFISYNKKHLELTLSDNLSKYGFGMSYIYYSEPDKMLSDDIACNTFIRNAYNRMIVNVGVLSLPNTMIINKTRIEKLNYEKIFDLLGNFNSFVVD